MDASHLAEQVMLDSNDLQAPAEGLSMPLRATLAAIGSDGALRVRFPDGGECLCDWLETSLSTALGLTVGDKLLVMPASADGPAIVLGRIGRYREPRPAASLAFEASESLTLRCGESSLELRANGQVLLIGDDVLLRAKGTQRIRAGSVSIN